MLEARGLARHAKGHTLFQGLDLVVSAGEALVVRGPSGSGKTLLLRALAAGPTEGDALIEACWPGDAAGYLSLKNRLHSAVRGLRRKGLGEALVFEGEVYRLVGVEVR